MDFLVFFANTTHAFFRESPGVLNLFETLVPKSHEGKGIGKILAKEAFEHCAQNGLRMRLSCWYLDGFLKRHPEEQYTKLVVE